MGYGRLNMMFQYLSQSLRIATSARHHIPRHMIEQTCQLAIREVFTRAHYISLKYCYGSVWNAIGHVVLMNKLRNFREFPHIEFALDCERTLTSFLSKSYIYLGLCIRRPLSGYCYFFSKNISNVQYFSYSLIYYILLEKLVWISKLYGKLLHV